ncbi:MAG: hypothetical protein WBG80_16520 [Bacteroidota bacterium]
MKSHGVTVLLFVALLMISMGTTAEAAQFSTGIEAGYNGGLSFRVSGMVAEFARGFPLGLELGVGHTRLDPGDPAAARKIFINDATNGTPQKAGWAWDMRFDFLYDVNLLQASKLYLYGGVRYSMFTANFNFIGGNEDFDVTSNQWGVGLGAKGLFAVSNSIDFSVTAGFDNYFENALKGHDTSYSPDGLDVNGRNDYTYEDAAQAVNQPGFQPLFMIGVAYRF